MINKIKILREKAGLTQAELSRKIGVERAYISRIERNKQQPGLETAIKLAQVFNCKIDDLFIKNKSKTIA